ncbi:MAG: hypothetical protein O6940_14605 [Ignavibacteria bacterium]|nr:hypothetical protein [Ignavibacteria bacterium]
MEALDILAWPVTVIILAIMFYKHINKLIDRIKKVKAVGFGAQFLPNQSTPKEKSPIDIVTKEGPSTEVDEVLSIFSVETIESADKNVKQYSGIESIKSPEDRERALLKYSKLVYLALQFKRIYQDIFGSQIKILQKLNSSNNETKESLKVYYEKARSANPNKGYENYSYDPYLQYLFGENLIQLNSDGKITITNIGQDLLTYINKSRLNLDKAL